MIPEVSQQRKTISQLHRDLQPLQGFGIEVLQMVILTVTWLATYATSREHLGSSSLPVGVAYLAISLWAVSRLLFSNFRFAGAGLCRQTL